MRLEDKAKSGTIWVTIGQMNLKLLSLLSLVILARLLAPQDFGIVVMASVVIEFMRLFGDFGISAAIIHHQDEIDHYANASFWMNISISAVLTLTTMAAAPLVVAFYQKEMLRKLIYLLSLGFFFQGIGATHYTLLTKELDFKKATLVKLISDTLVKGTTIIMAFAGFGVWSLVVPEVLIAPIKSLLYWWVCPWRPHWRIDFHYMKKIFDYGKNVFGTDLIRYVNINTDYLIIGKMLGETMLGFYSFAYNMAAWPVVNIIWIITMVTFPLFSKIQNDLPRLHSTFLKMIRVLSIITFPLYVGLFVTAQEVIPFVFGEKWLPAIPSFQILLVFAAIRSFTSPGGQILKAIGHPEKEFQLNLILAPSLILGIIAGVQFGIIGVSVATVIVLGVGGLFFLKVVLKQIDLSFLLVLKDLRPALVSSLLMGCGVALLRQLILPLVSSLSLMIMIYLVAGVILYFSCLYLMFRGNLKEIWILLISMLPGRRTPAESVI